MAGVVAASCGSIAHARAENNGGDKILEATRKEDVRIISKVRAYPFTVP